MTVQLELAAAPEHDPVIPAACGRRTRRRPIRGRVGTILKVIDKWPATGRAAVIIVMLFGGTAAVSLLMAAGAAGVGWLTGSALLAPVLLVITSAVRSTPPARWPEDWVHEGRRQAGLGSYSDYGTAQRQVVHMKGS
jgi:hypothetical protein